MNNTTRYLNTIIRFRSDLQAVNERFQKEYDRLERYKDSEYYENDKKFADEQRASLVDGLRREARERLSRVVDDMEKTYMERPASAPSDEQLRILQALQMRASVGRDEWLQAANSMEGCAVGQRVLEEIARKNGYAHTLVKELSGDDVRRSLNSLRLNGCTLISNLERPGEDRRTAVNSGNYTLFMLDREPKDEADTMRIFGHVTDYQQFSEAVNGEGA